MLSSRRSSLYCLCARIVNSLLEPSNTENFLSSPLTASSVRAVSDLCRGRTNLLMQKILFVISGETAGPWEILRVGILFKRPVIRY